MKEKILIYGAGSNCKTLLKYASLNNFEIVGILDSNKVGERICGREILSPSIIKEVDYDKIFITPKEHKNIILEVHEKFKVKLDNIIKPMQINIKYILPKIRSAKNIYFGTNMLDCLDFIFKNIIKEEGMLIINTLHDYEELIPDKPIYDEKNFIFGGYDIDIYQENKMFEFIKKTYPNSKMIMFIWNQCNGEYGIKKALGKYFSPDYLKSIFDYCITYHIKEAKEFGFMFYPEIYPLNAFVNGSEDISADLFFVGCAKNRLNLLHNVFMKLTRAGLKCHFWITGVEEKDQIHIDGLVYNKILPYEKALEEMFKCRCILEICAEGDETSFRFAEAVIYNKKLLINDKSIYERQYYNECNMQYFNTVDDIDVDWFNIPMCDYKYKGDFEPKYFFEEILGVEL